MAPVKLYGMTLSWNVTRCVAALEEAGVEHDVVPIDFSAGEHKSPEHLARNPFGQMPVLQDGDFYVWVSRISEVASSLSCWSSYGERWGRTGDSATFIRHVKDATT